MVKSLDIKEKTFLAKFFIIFFTGTILLQTIQITFLNNWLAAFQGFLTGINFHQNILFIDSSAYIVNNECSGLFSGIVLAAIVFGLKKPEIKQKIAIFLAGFAFLFPLNIVRIYTVLMVGKIFGFDAAIFLHTISWFVTSALVIGFWYYLTKKVLKKSFKEML